MTNPPQFYIDKPIFHGQKNSLIYCRIESCNWDFAGPRETLRHVWNEHYRMNHSQEIGVMEITPNLRDNIWLPS